MKTLLRFVVAAVGAALLSMLAPLAFAQAVAAVGTVQFVSGPAEIVRAGQTIAAVKSAPVAAGDLIRTSPTASLQLAMNDGAFISVRPSSEMRIEKYDYNPMTPTLGDAVLELVKGTMRTFTGELVSLNRDKFKMRTPLALLGIRGSGNVLSHTDDQGTFNHTLTGAHSVTSRDAGGTERTLVSLPGQTIQVLPGLAPRFVPTPAFILANATPPTKQAAGESEKKSDGTQTAPVNEAAPTSTTAAATGTVGGAATSAAQAATNTLVTTITTVQLPDTQNFFFGARSSVPYSGGGFEGIFPQGSVNGRDVQLNGSGAVTQVSNTTFATFIAGGALTSLPVGYTPVNFGSATVAFAGGTHNDGYRSTDGAIIQGRWEGGSINVTPTGQTATTSYALGPRSVAYQLFSATPLGTLAALTGSTSYTLTAATAATDAAGRIGQLTSASIGVNFSTLTAALTAALSVNNQSLSLSGTAAFSRGDGVMSWARFGGSTSNNLVIACSGTSCVNQYEGVANASFAGTAADWLAFNYRVAPSRGATAAYSDLISGFAALRAAASPTVGIALPQTGTSNLFFTNFQDAGSSFLGNATISGTLQANFSTRVASINATVTANGSPTFNATANNVPIVGVAMAATTNANAAAGIGAMTVTCTAGCATQTTTSGRFDGLFSNSTGTAGQGAIQVGNAGGNYIGTITLSTVAGPIAAGSTSALVSAVDARGPSATVLGLPTVALRRAAGGDRIWKLREMQSGL